MSTSRKTFTAQFDGYCHLCGEEVLAGDEAAYVDDDFACEDCWETEQAVQRGDKL